VKLVTSSGWYSSRGEEADLIVKYLNKVPGVKIHPKGSIDLHLTHLPLLPPELTCEDRLAFKESKFDHPFELREYQREAIDFASIRPAVLFLHDLGMGKTAMALGTVQTPSIAIVPTSAIYGWKLAAEAMGMKVQILHGKYKRDYLDIEADFYITTYGSAGYWLPCFKDLGEGPDLFGIYADEIHLIHKKSLQATQAFAGTRCQFRCGLTATPIRNRLPSLWGILNALQPKAWGTRVEFLERYANAVMGPYGMEFGAPTHVEELASRLKEVAIRRMWAEPGMDKYRPTLVRERIEVPITARKRVQHLDKATRKAMEKKRLGASTLRRLTEQRKEIGALKVKWAIESGWAQREAEKSVRSIWWCWFKEQAYLLHATAKKWGIPADIITGDSLSNKRATVLEEWEYGDITKPRMIVATQGALNFAVNLTTAHSALFLEYDWAPVNLVQAEKRHHRPGNPLKEVTASYLVIPGTTDDDIAEALYTKIEEEELILGESGQLEQVGQLTDHGITTSSTKALEELAAQICGRGKLDD